MNSQAPGGGGGARCSSASAKMAAAAGRSARLAAWGSQLRRGLAAGRQAVPRAGPVAAAVAGVALAGAGAAWHHGRVKAAAREGSLTVLAQVQPRPRTPLGGRRGRPQAAVRARRAREEGGRRRGTRVGVARGRRLRAKGRAGLRALGVPGLPGRDPW